MAEITNDTEENKNMKQSVIKVTGYLKKKVKLAFIECWKKWWCVLEGQLLLYYKSYVEYLKLSPCRGSLNMALVLCIESHPPHRIRIYTHSQFIVLRAKSRSKQQEWFRALLEAMPQSTRIAFNYFTVDFPSCTISKRKHAIRKSVRNKPKRRPYNECGDEENKPLENPSEDVIIQEADAIDVPQEIILQAEEKEEEEEEESLIDCILKEANHSLSLSSILMDARGQDISATGVVDDNLENNFQQQSEIDSSNDYSISSFPHSDDFNNDIDDYNSNNNNGRRYSLFDNPTICYHFELYSDFLSKISESDENNAATEDDWINIRRPITDTTTTTTTTTTEIEENNNNILPNKDDGGNNNNCCMNEQLPPIIIKTEAKQNGDYGLIRGFHHHSSDNRTDYDRDYRDNHSEDIAWSSFNSGLWPPDNINEQQRKSCKRNNDKRFNNNRSSITTTITEKTVESDGNYNRKKNGGTTTTEIGCEMYYGGESKSNGGYPRLTEVSHYHHPDGMNKSSNDESVVAYPRAENTGGHDISNTVDEGNLDDGGLEGEKYRFCHCKRHRYCKLLRRRFGFGKRPFKFLKRLFPKMKRKQVVVAVDSRQEFLRKAEIIPTTAQAIQNYHFNVPQNDINDGVSKITSIMHGNSVASNVDETGPESYLTNNEIDQHDNLDENIDTEYFQDKGDSSEDAIMDNNIVIITGNNESVLNSLLAENPEIKEFFTDDKSFSEKYQTTLENNVHGNVDVVSNDNDREINLSAKEEIPSSVDRITNHDVHPTISSNVFLVNGINDDSAEYNNNNNNENHVDNNNDDDVNNNNDDDRDIDYKRRTAELGDHFDRFRDHAKEKEKTTEALIGNLPEEQLKEDSPPFSGKGNDWNRPNLLLDQAEDCSTGIELYLENQSQQQHRTVNGDNERSSFNNESNNSNDSSSSSSSSGSNSSNSNVIRNMCCSGCQHKTTPSIPIKLNRRTNVMEEPSVNGLLSSSERAGCYNSNFNLDMLLWQLLIINQNKPEPDQTSYDYDIPRPHTSLLEIINKQRELDVISEHSTENTHTELENFDSDFRLNDADSLQITPDSLEQPWILCQKSNKNPLTTGFGDTWNNEFESEDDVGYPDSLNSVLNVNSSI